MNAPSANLRAGILIALLAALFTYGVIGSFSVRYPEYSSLNSGPGGAKLLYDSLSRTRGLTVSRNFLPPDYVEESNATIFYLALDFATGSEASFGDIERLANRGNRVVAALKWQGVSKPGETRDLYQDWHVKFAVEELHLYFSEAKDWRVLERDGAKLLAIERTFKKGSVVLVADTPAFTNHATAKLDRLGLVTAAIGPNSRVVFDEQHFGITESGSVVGLARRFRLTGLAAGLAFCAVLFIWKNAAGFPPPLDAVRVGNLAGRTSIAGLFTLLQRHIKPADLAATCWNEWLASHRSEVTPERMARAQAILRDFAGRPLDAVREIQTLLHSKGPQ